ncbi:hypothetical protein [Nocardia stercoris]|uniref:hypothetical protein n=1 Tax=Nocardia stercoris TaxID=2483361 RepID=UPI00131A23F3|nr:hypothetical protein [Nocardia stercoris]
MGSTNTISASVSGLGADLVGSLAGLLLIGSLSSGGSGIGAGLGSSGLNLSLS